MRALHFDGRLLRCVDDHPAPVAGEDEALVRVRLAGVCSTDLQILAGYMGFTGVPGHEFVGEVVDGPPELSGRRVVGEINYACGRCDICRKGLGRHCPQRRVMGILGADGAFAEYLAVPTVNLHPVPDGVADEEAVFTEPLVAASGGVLDPRAGTGRARGTGHGPRRREARAPLSPGPGRHRGCRHAGGQARGQPRPGRPRGLKGSSSATGNPTPATTASSRRPVHPTASSSPSPPSGPGARWY